MKKAIFVFALIPLTFSNLLSQEDDKNLKKVESPLQADSPTNGNVKAALPNFNKSAGDTLWYEDFSNGFVTNQWSTLGSWPWVYTNQGPGGFYSSAIGPLQSTSGANGFAAMKSDFYNTPRPANGAILISEYLTSGAINISPRASVLLRWQQGYRYCCSLTSEIMNVEVSVDSVNWITFDARMGRSSSIGVPIENMEFDITSVAANQSTIFIRFYNKSSYYYWMIDDIAIVEGVRNELTIEDNYLFSGIGIGSGYTMIPCSNGQTFTPAARIKNTGALQARNVRLKSSLNSGGNVLNSGVSNVVGALNPLEDTLLTINSQFQLPNTVGSYSVFFEAESDSINRNTNLSSYRIAVSDSTYARDYGIASSEVGSGSFPGGSANGSMLGLVYKISKTQKISSSSIFISTNTINVGTEIRVNVYELDTNATSVGASVGANVAQSNTYIIQASDLGQWLILPLNSAPGVNRVGSFLVAVEQVSGIQNGFQFRLGRDENAEKLQLFNREVVSFLKMFGIWGDVYMVPMIRLNVLNAFIGNCTPVGLSKNEKENDEFQVYPNPSQGQFKIDLPLNSTIESIAIYGIDGTIVLQKNTSNNNSTINFDLSDYPKGLYFIRMNSNKGIVTKKIILQ